MPKISNPVSRKDSLPKGTSEMSKINKNWTAHLSEEEDVTEFRQRVISSKEVLERLSTLCDKHQEELLRKLNSSESFKGDFAALSAHTLGRIAAYKHIQDMIKI